MAVLLDEGKINYLELTEFYTVWAYWWAKDDSIGKSIGYSWRFFLSFLLFLRNHFSYCLFVEGLSCKISNMFVVWWESWDKFNSLEVRKLWLSHMTSSFLIVKHSFAFSLNNLNNSSMWVADMQLYFLWNDHFWWENSPISGLFIVSIP